MLRLIEVAKEKEKKEQKKKASKIPWSSRTEDVVDGWLIFPSEIFYSIVHLQKYFPVHWVKGVQCFHLSELMSIQIKKYLTSSEP